MRSIIVIPARYASTRLPGKPLIDIKGKTLIQRTYLQAMKVKNCQKVVVATDDERIFEHVKSFGGDVEMTDKNISNGSERCFQIFDKFQNEFDVLINIQGDEPLIQPHQIEDLISMFDNPEIEIATLIKKISEINEIENPNNVKCVVSKSKRAIYFSRFAIPFNREKIPLENISYFKHIGVYGFYKSIISKIRNLNYQYLNQIEQLEQIQWLENDLSIYTLETNFQSPAVDTPEDLIKIEKFLDENPEMI